MAADVSSFGVLHLIGAGLIGVSMKILGDIVWAYLKKEPEAPKNGDLKIVVEATGQMNSNVNNMTETIKALTVIMNGLNKKMESLCADTAECKRKTDVMFDMHDKYDEDGSPKWFMPRSWLRQVEELIKMQSQATTYLKIIAQELRKSD